MKILAINCSPLNLSYFTKRGLDFEVEYKFVDVKFPLQYLYDIENQNGEIVKMFTPFPHNYLEQNYKNFDYSFILVGYNESDYPESKNTGGYSYFNPLSCGTFWATISQDNPNIYAVHELHHLLCTVINIHLGNRVPIDFMDKTYVDGIWQPYYLNNQPENPVSNHAQTWNNIKNWLPQLKAIKYESIKTVTLKRGYANANQQLGDLSTYGFACKTLELPWKNNQKNISCIPKGKYTVKWTFSPKFLRYTYEIMNVPNRSGVRLHKGNYFYQVQGCILLGDSYGDLNKDTSADILNSTITIEKFENFMQNKDFILEII